MGTVPFTILLVDDNEFVLRPLSRFLRQEGYRVLEARDGREALRRVADHVDLVILDGTMPGLSGLEVLASLRETYSDTDLPVMIATASSSSSQIVEAFELGANDYLTKPLDLPVVLARLRSRLRSKTPRRSRRARAAAAPGSRRIEAGTVLDGTYRLEALIGRGSFTEVYRATHLGRDLTVALKVLRPDGRGADERVRQRLLREGRSICHLQHPNVVTVMDAGVTAGGVPFLATELLEGRTLEAELKLHGRLSPARCAEILLPICDVLAKAHAAEIVHRDIKPQNIFLQQAPRGEIVKVLDFGIAKLMIESAPRPALDGSGAGPGTPAYMAPERFSGQAGNGKSDIYSLDLYSLGITVYKMLVGELPFTPADGNLAEMALMHQTQEPTRLRDLRPELPAEIEAVVLQALAKDPSRRPSARELAVRYCAALGIEVLAAPDPVAARSKPAASDRPAVPRDEARGG